MYALILTVTLLGQSNPYLRRYLDEEPYKRSYPQEQLVQQHLDQRQQEQLASDEKMYWIIGGAIVAGLALCGLLARGKDASKK